MSQPLSSSDSILEIAPPSAIELLWINNRGAVLGSVVAFLAVALVILGVMTSSHATRIASETLLSGVTDDSGWREVIAKYPRTPASAADKSRTA